MMAANQDSANIMLKDSRQASVSFSISTTPALERPYYTVAKRVIDVGLIILSLIILIPLLLLIAVVIKVNSEGPVLYTQERIGYDPHTHGLRSFRLYKFRSMRVNCDDSLHRTHVAKLIQGDIGVPPAGSSVKMSRDPRITGVGHILRKTSLDELPQLFNVLIGDMSLVGPRPALPYEVALYKDWHWQRLYCSPGLTGWWQVKGRCRVSFDDMVKMDVWYIDHRCLTLDLKILLLTPWAVVTGKGAG